MKLYNKSFTMIELMISATVFLTILYLVMNIFVVSNNSWAVINTKIDLQNSIYNVFDIIKREFIESRPSSVVIETVDSKPKQIRFMVPLPSASGGSYILYRNKTFWGAKSPGINYYDKSYSYRYSVNSSNQFTRKVANNFYIPTTERTAYGNPKVIDNIQEILFSQPDPINYPNRYKIDVTAQKLNTLAKGGSIQVKDSLIVNLRN